MSTNRSGILWQLIAAFVLSAGLTLLLHWAGPTTMTIALFVLLTLFFFYAIALARALLMARRPRARPFGSSGGRGDWSGVREPRRPRPPNWPPRAAAVVPEDSEPLEPAGPIGHPETERHQTLRSEDSVA